MKINDLYPVAFTQAARVALAKHGLDQDKVTLEIRAFLIKHTPGEDADVSDLAMAAAPMFAHEKFPSDDMDDPFWAIKGDEDTGGVTVDLGAWKEFPFDVPEDHPFHGKTGFMPVGFEDLDDTDDMARMLKDAVEGRME